MVRVAPARPAVAAGVRTAVAATVPLAFALLLGMPEAVWVAVAAFMASAIDKGGAYQARARTLGAFALVAGLGGAIGALTGHHPAIAVPLTLAWVTACGLAFAYGDGAASVGTVAAVLFVVSASDPAPDLAAALSRGGLLAGGGVWAMALSLGLWPIRVYRPARLAVGAAYRAVADYASGIAGVTRGPVSDDGWHGLIRREPARVRQALEDARRVLLAIRRRRARESGRGERLLVLLENADRMFANLAALADVVEGDAGGPHAAEGREAAATGVAAFAETVRGIAEAVERESPGGVAVRSVGGAGTGPGAAGNVAVTGGPVGAAPGPDTATGGAAAGILARLGDYAVNAAEVAASLADERQPRPAWAADAVGPDRRSGPEGTRVLAILRESLAADSLVLQHALRVGITAAAAVALSTALGLQHGYWITLTAVVVLQPYMGATVQRGLQRVAGTVIGAGLAALLAAAVHDPRGILLFVFLFSGASVALLPLSYAVFAMFLTPAFVLLAEAVSGNWQLAGVRTANTLIGGGLALAAIRLLWPSPERQRLPEHAAEALSACGAYLAHATARFLPRQEHPHGNVSDVRRAFGLAANNAETSLQRLLAETPGETLEAEAYMTLITYARRLVAAAIALASRRQLHGGDAEDETVAEVGKAARRVLDDLSDAVLRGRPPEPLTDLPIAPVEDPDLRASLVRVARQLAVLHGAVGRLVGATEPAVPAAAGEGEPSRGLGR